MLEFNGRCEAIFHPDTGLPDCRSYCALRVKGGKYSFGTEKETEEFVCRGAGGEMFLSPKAFKEYFRRLIREILDHKDLEKYEIGNTTRATPLGVASTPETSTLGPKYTNHT